MKNWFTRIFNSLFKRNKPNNDVKTFIPATKTYVIALDGKHFNYWCYINGYDPRDRSLRYVTDISVLYGVDGRFAKFVFYGPWRERKDYNELLAQVQAIGWYS